MDGVAVFLLSVAGILLIGTFGDVLSRRTGIPDAVWLIGAGILIGPVLGVVRHDQVLPLVPYFAPLVLVAVLFESGTRVKFSGAGAAAGRAAAVALLGFAGSVAVISAGTVLAASFGILPGEWTWVHGLLVGAILGAPSSPVAAPALAAASFGPSGALGQARTAQSLADLAGRESAYAETLSVTAALALLALFPSGGADGLARSFGLGAAAGAVVGFIWIMFLKMLHSSVYAYPVTLAVLIVLSVAVGRAGGAAPLGVLAVAIVLGNAPAIARGLKLSETLALGDEMRGFSSQLAFVIKSFFFTYMGVGLEGSWPVAALGLVLAALALVVRAPAVAAAVPRIALPVPQRQMLAVAVPRGLMAGVLAAMAAGRGVPGLEPLSPLVFSAVLASIVIFAAALPLARRPPRVAAAVIAPDRPGVLRQTGAPVFPSSSTTPSSPFSESPISSSPQSDEDIKPGDGFRW